MEQNNKINASVFELYEQADTDGIWRYNAFWSPTSYVYALAYKDAADNLISYAVSHNAIDIALYPVMFLYRHYLELQLKETLRIITEGRKHYGRHPLVKLWEKLRQSLREEGFEQHLDAAFLDAIGMRIDEFDKMDKKSQTFRYPLDGKGAEWSPPFKQINLWQVSAIVGEIDDYLQGFLLHIANEAEANEEDASLQSDMEEQMREP